MEREQEKVVKKLKTVTGATTEKLQQVLDQIQALKDQLTSGKCMAVSPHAPTQSTYLAPSLHNLYSKRRRRWRGDAGAEGVRPPVYEERERCRTCRVQRAQRHARHHLQTRQSHRQGMAVYTYEPTPFPRVVCTRLLWHHRISVRTYLP